MANIGTNIKLKALLAGHIGNSKTYNSLLVISNNILDTVPVMLNRINHKLIPNQIYIVPLCLNEKS